MTGKKSWETLSSRKVYENPWIRVDENQVLNPSGKESLYGLVSFKNLAIGVIPLDQNLNTWLVGQWRYPLNEYSWEIPMGGGPVGIDKLESAKRELKEETGLQAAQWQEIMRIHTSNSVTNEEGFVFVATDLEEGDAELGDTEEDLVVEKLPFEQAVERVLNGIITDSISISGILKVDYLLREGRLKF